MFGLGLIFALGQGVAAAEPGCVTITAHLPANIAMPTPPVLRNQGPRRRYVDAPVPCVEVHLAAWQAPLPGPLADGHRLVQSAWEAHFGPLPPEHIGWTTAGTVSLPMVSFLSPEARAAVQRHERLFTEAQAEKATDGLGPERDGLPVFTHFLGADPPYTDLWGRPEAVAALIDVLGRWWPRCLTLLPHGPLARCTVQVGDLGWFGPLLPDPLGHFDHYRGECMDIRLFRTDASRYEAYWNRPDDRPGFGHAYDPLLTAAFLALVAEHNAGGDLYFNDPAVLRVVSAAKAAPKHDDHLHVCFGAREP